METSVASRCCSEIKKDPLLEQKLTKNRSLLNRQQFLYVPCLSGEGTLLGRSSILAFD